jgi:type IV pilus assembly protein PilM
MDLSGFFSFFTKKEQSVIGVDIGSSAIKVVQVKKKRGRVVLETYGELSLGPYGEVEVGRATNLPPEKLAEALKDILRESKTTTLAGGVALPLASSLISFVSLPPVDEKKLGEIVPLEARKYIPVPMNEVMLDWSVIPQEDSYSVSEGEAASSQNKPVQQHQDVLIVAILNEFINNYQTIMSVSGVKPSFYEIELFSSIRAVVEQGINAVMIIDMGARTTKLYIVERGILRSSHILNKGSQDITLALSKALTIGVNEAEHMKRVYGLTGGPEHKELTEIITVNLDYIFYEANATLMNYQKKYNRTISKIILTGGGVLLKGLTDLAKVSFQTEVIYANPFGKLETPAFLEEQLQTAGPEFAVAIGAALRRIAETQ